MEDQQLLLVQNMLAYAAQRDLDTARLCALGGLQLEDIRRKKATITVQQLYGLWKHAEMLSHDPCFSLHFAESLKPAALGIAGGVIQYSATVGEALTQAAAMIPLVTPLLRMELTRSRQRLTVRLIPLDVPGAQAFTPYMAELLMVMAVHEMDGFLFEKIVPLEVRLPYPVKEVKEYARIFRCTPLKRKDEYALVFDSNCYDMPVIAANRELQEILLRRIGELYREQPASPAFRAKIYNYLLANAHLGICSLEDVAANFNLGARSLQRRLGAEGSSFQEIADEVRQSLAKYYLSSGNYGLKDIAYMLGYNEPSAFARAFKRWTGTTPGAFRN